MKLHTRGTDTLQALLAQEDTDGSKTITVEDQGPKRFVVTARDGRTLTVEGTYRLANLLQELYLSEDGEIDSELIDMPPLARIDHLMRTHYWKTLTRRIDEAGLRDTLTDEKFGSGCRYLYVPEQDIDGLAYYRRLAAAHPDIDVVALPAVPDIEYLDSIEYKPGLLALKYDAAIDQPLPYVVPGGRFNEMYGWDSYFIALGLIEHEQFELARGMLENMAYQIRYYGKMLNANRSYYLTRSQPPFYTAYLRAFLDTCGQQMSSEWIREHLSIAIREYETVWMTPGRRLTAIGLNRYRSDGHGRSKETEPGHFDFELKKYADRHGLDVREFERRYDAGRIIEPDLDRYFMHDRSMRESGLDTTTRFDGCCADLACIDLNSILYRVETDIAGLIDQYFGGHFDIDPNVVAPDTAIHPQASTSNGWRARATHRQALMKRYLWNEAEGTYYDYNVRKAAPQPFVSITNLLPLWAGSCTPAEAARLVATEFPRLLKQGGLASTGPIDRTRLTGPERQWDAPYGWAPHQIMVWEGLWRYGFESEARQAANAWLQMMVRASVEYNGLITEKFNVEKSSHKVDVEYGNVGASFEYVPAGGFGWTNTSFLLGLKYLSEEQKAALNALAD
ncbi:MAG: trehalase family glycosidase [Lautropia sp.]|nr:trehalase family glycosidase [Lautropia sp.]